MMAVYLFCNGGGIFGSMRYICLTESYSIERSDVWHDARGGRGISSVIVFFRSSEWFEIFVFYRNDIFNIDARADVANYVIFYVVEYCGNFCGLGCIVFVYLSGTRYYDGRKI